MSPAYKKVYAVALESISAGAPGLGEMIRQGIARSIALKMEAQIAIGDPAGLKLLIRCGESEPSREVGLAAGSPMAGKKRSVSIINSDLLAALVDTRRILTHDPAAGDEVLQRIEASIVHALSLQDHAADEREACAKVADDWLSAYGNRNPKFVDAQTWACGAVRDIANAIRQRGAMFAEQETK